ncbi:MAG TPA: pyridoxine 5'-phosphate synthase [Planctomycetes bacterium]|nr:pyridoxine 5'-phosphate synthase [Planctomycetota bacterium]
MPAELGVNIDHVATVRQARRAVEPDPVAAAVLAELGGADAITVHLREDRRHVQDRDVRILRDTVRTRLNLEMAAADEIVRIACAVRPDQATLVPEKRQELTTEGGLDVPPNLARIRDSVARLKDAGILVSLFIEPDGAQVDAAVAAAADAVEFHTGAYAAARGEPARRELGRILDTVDLAAAAGLRIHAGHGLTYWNVAPLAQVRRIFEFNIGHSIVSRAIFVGMERAVREMKDIILRAALHV